MLLTSIFIDNSPKRGKGVFARTDIPKGIIIETSPVVVMNKQERILLDQTLLHDYIFEWGDRKNQCCVALGYISVYNHSYKSNCEYEMDYDEQVISIRTMRVIKAGEELFINYNGNWNDAKPVWFDVKE